jgi:ER lumen protein retaining receptor
MSHLASINILIHKIQTSRSCRGPHFPPRREGPCGHVSHSQRATGISFKTQALYVLVFVTRYLDLFLGEWISFYNTVMKLFFIGSSAYILYLMKFRFKSVLVPVVPIAPQPPLLPKS